MLYVAGIRLASKDVLLQILLMLNTLHGSTALITGASAGIGWEFARQLAPVADTLILVARREDKLTELKEKLLPVNPGLKVFIKACDLSSTRQRKELLKWIHDAGFPVNLLVNNAGFGDWGAFESANWSKLEDMIKVNIMALTHLSHALLPLLRERENGAAILNVSSVASAVPLPWFGVYAAGKAYVTSLSEALREELRETPVSVTTLCPGPVETEFAERARRDPDDLNYNPADLHVRVEEVVNSALDGLLKDKGRVIPGWKVAVVMTLLSMLPIILVRLFYRFMPQR